LDDQTDHHEEPPNDLLAQAADSYLLDRPTHFLSELFNGLHKLLALTSIP
jgi:hypothetical protein